MTFDELQQLAEKDLKINDTELDLESLKTPQLHNKYLKHLTKFKLMLSRAETEHNIMKKEKWEYYTGKAPAEVYAEKPFDLKILRTDIDDLKYYAIREILNGNKQKFQKLMKFYIQFQRSFQYNY